MSNGGAGSSAQPGWYPDPAGSPQLRWFDGQRWTEYLSAPAGAPVAPQQVAPQAVAPQAAAYQSITYQAPEPRPELAAGAPVYSIFIWILAAIEIIPAITLLFWRPSFQFHTEISNGQQVPVPDFSSIFTAGYVILLILGWLVPIAFIVLSYFDWKYLKGIGVVRPFHWAFSFIALISGGFLVYVIGRSVIVHKVAPRRGLIPIWIAVGVFVVAIIIGSIWAAQVLSDLTSQLSGVSSNT